MARRRPNIFYIHTHDTGRAIAPYGFKADTPNLSRFASSAAVFRNAHCAAPSCSPSRAAMLTGRWPHQAGMLGLAHFGHRLSDPRHHLIHTLREAGYISVLGGMQHVADRADRVGYDRLLLPVDTEPVVDTVCPAFEAFMNDPPEEPIFASVGFTETHRPFEEPGAGEPPAWCQVPAPMPDTPETREDASAFAASLRRVDEGIGRVLDAIRNAGIWDESIIIITTDHGPPFPEMKCNLTVHGTGVMLMMRGPGIPETAGSNAAVEDGAGAAGTVEPAPPPGSIEPRGGPSLIDSLVSQVDLYPTLCELIGVEKPEWLEGESLLPLLRGERRQVHEEIFAECTYHVEYEPMRAVRTPRYLYVRRFDERPAIVPANCDDGPSKSLFVREGWIDRRPAVEELYDTLLDPQERRNLAGSPQYGEVMGDLAGRLQAWMARTGDPLLDGPLTRNPRR